MHMHGDKHAKILADLINSSFYPVILLIRTLFGKIFIYVHGSSQMT